MGVTQAVLVWSDAKGTASYRMLLAGFEKSFNISDLRPGTRHICPVSESNETQNGLQAVEGELQNRASASDFIVDWF